MWKDYGINIVLVLVTMIFSGLGIHVSTKPVSIHDTSKRFWMRRLTWIWVVFAIAVILQIATIIVQTFQQGSSSRVLSDLQHELKDVKSELGTTRAIIVAALPILEHQSAIAPPAATSTRVSARGAEISTHDQTVIQALRDAIAKPAASQSLSPAQISLLGISASELAMEIKHDFAMAMKRQEDIDQKSQDEAEQRFIQGGLSKEDAHQSAAGMRVGSSWAMHMAETEQQSAFEAISNHKAQIDALIAIGKSDPSGQPNALYQSLASLADNCGPKGVNPAVGTSNCEAALNRIVALTN